MASNDLLSFTGCGFASIDAYQLKHILSVKKIIKKYSQL